MIGKIVLLIFGFAAGMLVSLLMDRKSAEEDASQPVLIREEKRTVVVWAEQDVTQEELLLSVSRSWIAKILQAKLTEQIWRYVKVESEYNPKDMMYHYKARLMVVDYGIRNILVDEERCTDHDLEN